MGAQCVSALSPVGGYIPLNIKVSILYCCFSIFHYSSKNPNKLKCKNSNIYSSMKKIYLYSIDSRDNCVAGLDFSKWNLSFSHGCLGDCSFLWQSFCDVKNHMLYTKLNLKCE